MEPHTLLLPHGWCISSPLQLPLVVAWSLHPSLSVFFDNRQSGILSWGSIGEGMLAVDHFWSNLHLPTEETFTLKLITPFIKLTEQPGTLNNTEILHISAPQTHQEKHFHTHAHKLSIKSNCGEELRYESLLYWEHPRLICCPTSYVSVRKYTRPTINVLPYRRYCGWATTVVIELWQKLKHPEFCVKHDPLDW